jgi:hypothetical protein
MFFVILQIDTVVSVTTSGFATALPNQLDGTLLLSPVTLLREATVGHVNRFFRSQRRYWNLSQKWASQRVRDNYYGGKEM